MHLMGLRRQGSYVDSIALMQIAEELHGLPGIEAATLVMGTPANLANLEESKLRPREAEDAGPNDLVVAVRATNEQAGRAALQRAEALLANRGRADSTHIETRPRSIVSAARRTVDANVAAISVPGEHAVAEAHQALSAGLHVFLFSDGVSLDDELALKQRGRARGLLVMGPECGTSIVHGVGLGFANRVRRGPIGLVGASGTGLQEVTALVHRLGGGISHAIGTGGRDLDSKIGGITTLQALELLAGDADTRVIVIVSKPASPVVADDVLSAASAAGKRVVACLLGFHGATRARVDVAATLEEAAVAAVKAAGIAPPALEASKLAPGRAPLGQVLGLYTGGTLCDEARRIVGDASLRFVDFGATEYTRGRPHPMIDPALRSAAVARAGQDDRVGVLLLDVVLGSCAHRDPAHALAAAITEARTEAAQRGRRLEIVAHVVGTEDDPQGLAGQESALRELDVIVCSSNRQAALTALALARGA
jgi:FdrA protein